MYIRDSKKFDVIYIISNVSCSLYKQDFIQVKLCNDLSAQLKQHTNTLSNLLLLRAPFKYKGCVMYF